jgi:hypothetical protein
MNVTWKLIFKKSRQGINKILKDCSAFIFLDCLTLKIEPPGPSKHQELLAQQQSVTSQNTWIFGKPAVRLQILQSSYKSLVGWPQDLGGRMSYAPILCTAMEIFGSFSAWHPGYVEPWPSLFLSGTVHLKKCSELLHLLSKEVG